MTDRGESRESPVSKLNRKENSQSCAVADTDADLGVSGSASRIEFSQQVAKLHEYSASA